MKLSNIDDEKLNFIDSNSTSLTETQLHWLKLNLSYSKKISYRSFGVSDENFLEIVFKIQNILFRTNSF